MHMPLTPPAVVLALFLLPLPQESAQDPLEAVRQELRRFDQAALDELLQRAENDPDPAVRRLILERLGRLRLSAIREALERRAASDPDPDVALVALERLRLQQAHEVGRLFAERLALAHAQKDQRSLETLVAQHQKWVTHAQGAALPAFLQDAPAVFEAAPRQKRLRALVIGDIGEPGPDQREVAGAVAAYHRARRFDLGVTVGDNFVPRGVTGPIDPRWKGEWEDLYRPLGIPIFASTGNHDWGFADSPAAEILYSRVSPSWRMPSLYYSFTAGPAQFFAIATHAWSETQAEWLARELGRSPARWRIVYGHHGIHSYGVHGPTPELQESLLPVLRGRAQLYLFGHEHIVQDLEPEDGVHFLNAPAGGQAARPVRTGERTLFADSFHGFVALDIDEERIVAEFVDTAGRVRYTKELR
jgi:tartrate-resistant acid phosphatase type 5